MTIPCSPRLPLAARALRTYGSPAKLLRIPVILHCRNNPESERKTNLSWNVRLANKIIAVSNNTANKMQLNSNLTSKLNVIYNAIDISKYQNGRDISIQFVDSEQDKIIALVGQITARKGILDFLKMAQIDWKINDVLELNVGQLLNEQNLTLQDKFWAYRYVAVTFQEMYRFGMPADFGARIKFNINV